MVNCSNENDDVTGEDYNFISEENVERLRNIKNLFENGMEKEVPKYEKNFLPKTAESTKERMASDEDSGTSQPSPELSSEGIVNCSKSAASMTCSTSSLIDQYQIHSALNIDIVTSSSSTTISSPIHNHVIATAVNIINRSPPLEARQSSKFSSILSSSSQLSSPQLPHSITSSTSSIDITSRVDSYNICEPEIFNDMKGLNRWNDQYSPNSSTSSLTDYIIRSSSINQKLTMKSEESEETPIERRSELYQLQSISQTAKRRELLLNNNKEFDDEEVERRPPDLKKITPPKDIKTEYDNDPQQRLPDVIRHDDELNEDLVFNTAQSRIAQYQRTTEEENNKMRNTKNFIEGELVDAALTKNRLKQFENSKFQSSSPSTPTSTALDELKALKGKKDFVFSKIIQRREITEQPPVVGSGNIEDNENYLNDEDRPPEGIAKENLEKFTNYEKHQSPPKKSIVTIPVATNGENKLSYESTPIERDPTIISEETKPTDIIPQKGFTKQLLSKWNSMTNLSSSISISNSYQKSSSSNENDNNETIKTSNKTNLVSNKLSTSTSVLFNGNNNNEMNVQEPNRRTFKHSIVTPMNPLKIDRRSSLYHYSQTTPLNVVKLNENENENSLPSTNDESELPPKGTTKNLLNRFNQIDDSSISSPLSPSVPNKRKNSSNFFNFQTDNEPMVNEELDMSKKLYTNDVIDIERGKTKSLLQKFTDVPVSTETNVHKKKLFTPPRETETKVLFESQPTPSTIMEETMTKEDIIPLKGSAQVLRNKWQNLQKEDKKVKTTTGRYIPKRFTSTTNPSAIRNGNKTMPLVEKCCSCEKTVYAMERIETDKRVYHKQCFRCSHCKSALKVGRFAAIGGNLYCIPHYQQMFRLRGKYEENDLTRLSIDHTLSNTSSTPPTNVAVPDLLEHVNEPDRLTIDPHPHIISSTAASAIIQ
ncbi:hypothetical protein SNEBB_010959 [Seison nebaliae]|nr:hypothetical protein SNEBB_010959 [Seison nebaliae]